jgi:hypothetical protein
VEVESDWGRSGLGVYLAKGLEMGKVLKESISRIG